MLCAPESKLKNEIAAAGPVSRILSAGLLRRDGHSSGQRIAAVLWRPTRRFYAPSRHVPKPDSQESSPGSLPIWSCSVWGLPCPRHYWRGGALLPHLFTLTPARKGPGGIFSVALSVERSHPNQRGGPPGRYPAHCSAEFGLSSPRVRRREKRPSGPAAYGIIICDEGGVLRPGSWGPRLLAPAYFGPTRSHGSIIRRPRS